MRKMNLFLGVACAAAIGGMAPEAHSHTQSAMAGHSWPNHFDSCFGSSWPMMINNCAGTPGSQRLLVIPVQLPDPGMYRYVAARAGGNGSNGMTNCQAISVFGTSGYSFSQIVSTSTSSAIQHLSLGAVWRAPSGTTFFECNVAQGGGRVTDVEIIW